ncbi:MAG: hypothetical protein WBO82_08660 [Neisseria sp.]
MSCLSEQRLKHHHSKFAAHALIFRLQYRVHPPKVAHAGDFVPRPRLRGHQQTSGHVGASQLAR